MSTPKQYSRLETRICKGDLAGLDARWEFGRKLLAERGDQKQLPCGFAASLYANLDMHVQVSLLAYQKELSRRMRFAELYPTKAKVRAAFKQYGSWSEICAHGLAARDGERPAWMPPPPDADPDSEEVKRHVAWLMDPNQDAEEANAYRAWKMEPRHSPDAFTRNHYAIRDRINATLRDCSAGSRYMSLAALRHWIEQEMNEFERQDRREREAAAPDRGLLGLVS